MIKMVAPYVPPLEVGFRSNLQPTYRQIDDVITVTIPEPYRFLEASSREAGCLAYQRGRPVNFPGGGVEFTVFPGQERYRPNPRIAYTARDTILSDETVEVKNDAPWSSGLEGLLHPANFGIRLRSDGHGNFKIMDGDREVGSIQYHDNHPDYPDHSFVLEVSASRFPNALFEGRVGKIVKTFGVKRTRRGNAELFAEHFLELFHYYPNPGNEKEAVSRLYVLSHNTPIHATR